MTENIIFDNKALVASGRSKTGEFNGTLSLSDMNKIASILKREQQILTGFEEDLSFEYINKRQLAGKEVADVLAFSFASVEPILVAKNICIQ